jgi:hypothetical protein
MVRRAAAERRFSLNEVHPGPRFMVAAVVRCATLNSVKLMPMSIRLDKQLRQLLAEGARRTPYNQQELLRRTLRLHLREVIEQEASVAGERVTTVAPWPKGALARAYRRVDKRWEQIEAAATAAQGRPSWEG